MEMGTQLDPFGLRGQVCLVLCPLSLNASD